MVETWVLLSLAYPLFWALANIIDKFLLEKKIKNVYSQCIVVGFITLLAAISVSFFVSFQNITLKQVFFGLVAGFLYSVGYYVYFYVLKFEEVSRVISVIYLTPIIVSLFAFLFLGESLYYWKYLAIILVSIGAFLIGMQKFDLKPVMRKSFWILFVSCFFWAGTNLINKYLISDVNFWNIFALQQFGLSSGMFLSVFRTDARANFLNALRYCHFSFVSEGLNFLALILALLAYRTTEVSKVSALSSLQPLYLLILMLFISFFIPKVLKEVFTKQTLFIKIIAVLMIFTGAFLIAL